MAPRRGARLVKVERLIDYNNLTVKEVLCPICRSILIEPVTLPCHHVFCSSCFQGTMENANLVCPLCRLRIGSWLRSCKKEKKLINVEYWNAIKRLFPDQIKNKMEGLEDTIIYDDPLIQIAKPGELKQEYESQIKKETETYRKEREAEIKASEALIHKLREEEEYRKVIEEEKLRLDEEIARKLANELNSIEKKSIEVSSSQIRPSNIKNNSRKCGPLDKFLKNKNLKNPASQTNPSLSGEEKKIDYSKKDYTCRVLCHKVEKNEDEAIGLISLDMLNQKISAELQHVLDSGNHSDSSDSIESECRYFKPIDYRKCLPCQRTTPIRVPAIRGHVKINEFRAPEGQKKFQIDHSISAFAVFKKLPFEEKGCEEKRISKQLTKRRRVSLTNQNKEPESSKRGENSSQDESTTKEETQNKTDVLKKQNSILKRKVCQEPPVLDSPSKKAKLRSDFAFMRFQDSPSSPFRGFDNSKSEGILSRKRSVGSKKMDGATSKDSMDPHKIQQQVESDYELARKLQDQFNSWSYSTRSAAPRRGTKVTRQATLDSLLTK